jgi:hypothetical protein
MSTRLLSRVGLACLGCALLALPAFGDSQARIVRLSDVQGSVKIDKNTGLGFENAFLNLPVTQGTELKTGTNGRAEVEFEDGSTLRLTPNTTVHFSALSLQDSGQRASAVDLVEGLAYVNWMGKDELNLSFAREKVTLDHAAHFRIDASPLAANLAVFKGEVNVVGPSGSLTVEKKKTVTFDPAENDKSTIASKVAEEPFDSWDKEAVSYHDQYAKNTNSSPYGYGLSDLNYYGAFSSVPGYGMMWQPYFVGAGWDPFMDGAWGFYPGFGYMFASAYPWGWLPYRYGNWMFVPSFGWMWQPGGWNTWLTVPHYTATTLATPHTLVPPTGTVRTVAVGRGAALSTMNSRMSSRMVVNSGTAGLGIPRGSVNNLGHLNHQVAKSGFAEVHSAPQFSSVRGARNSGYSGSARAQGGNASGRSAPAASSSSSSMGSMGHASGASSGHMGGGGGSPHR